MAILFTLLGVYLLFRLQLAFYCRKWADGLDTDIRFTDAAVNEGDISSLTETVINRKALPLATLQIKFHVNRKLRFVNKENTVVTDNSYSNDIFSIMAFEKIERRIPLACTGRGYYHIHSMDVISYDLFFKKKSVLTRPLATSMYVYPKPVDPKLLDVPFQKMMGTILTKRYAFEDPFEFRGIRQYQTYDSMKDINWKASARTGDWKVNVHNYTSSQQVTILLNLANDSNWRYDRLFEDSIRIASSYADRLIAAGIPTRLVTNGIDSMTSQELILPYGAGKQHALAVKEGLSRIDSEKEAADFLPFLKEVSADSDVSSTLYILISKIQNEELLSDFGSLCRLCPGSQWIAPLHKDMEFLPERCPDAVSMKWEVAYIE